MAQNPSFNPFELCRDWVVDDEHVRVERAIVTRSGGPSARFIKVFKSSPQFDYSWFNTHEGELLLRFKLQRLARVAQVVDLEWNDDNSFDRVETLDAGPSLDHWLRLNGQADASGESSHPLAAPVALLLILRSSLLALQEIHNAGHVHCDIDDRNICLPFAAHPQMQGAFVPVWHQLKLIDFAFSVSKEHPLRVPLPIQPNPQLHSPAFMQALESDYRLGTSRHVQRLDGRIDLFALGTMSERLLASLRPLWRSDSATDRCEHVVRQFNAALMAEDSDASRPYNASVCLRLLGLLDGELNREPGPHLPPFRMAGIGTPGRARQPGSGGGPAGERFARVVSLGPVAATPLAPSPIRHPVAATPLAPLASVASAHSRPMAPVSVQKPAGPVPTAASGARGIAVLPPQRRSFMSSIWGRFADSLKLERYRRAAKRGRAEACFQVAGVLLRGLAVQPDPQGALAWLLAAAQKGHAAAQVAAASCFDIGLGGVQDDAQAVHWYTAAASQGHPAGHYGLGLRFVQGRGLPRDERAAVQHFREAAAGGMAEAYDALGQMVLSGRGVEPHRDDAIECFRRAADLGHGPSADQLGRLCELPEPGHLPDPKLARQWYRKAIAMGYEPARANLQRLQERFPT